jgi:hypothetical protein
MHTSQLRIGDIEGIISQLCQERIEIDARHKAIYEDLQEAYVYSGTGGTPSAATLAGLLFHGLINDTVTATALEVERAQDMIDAAGEINNAVDAVNVAKLRRMS